MQSRLGILILATAFAVAPAAAQDMHTMAKESLLQSLRLPRATQEARYLGVADRDIRDMFDWARSSRYSASELTDLFEVENASIREHGPVDNFGAFVQARHAEGLRGRELAAAIRAEHAARGMGKGFIQGQSGHPEGKGDPRMNRGNVGKPGSADKLGRPVVKPASPGKSGAGSEKPDASKKGGDSKDKKGGSE